MKLNILKYNINCNSLKMALDFATQHPRNTDGGIMFVIVDDWGTNEDEDLLVQQARTATQSNTLSLDLLCGCDVLGVNSNEIHLIPELINYFLQHGCYLEANDGTRVSILPTDGCYSRELLQQRVIDSYILAKQYYGSKQYIPRILRKRSGWIIPLDPVIANEILEE